MPWKYNGNIIREGQSWTNDDEITHPKNWAFVWSDEDKVAAGLVWEDTAISDMPVDTRFYFRRDSDGNPIAKELDDINEVDSEGNPVLDMDGTPIVTRGLKFTAIANCKQMASSLLQETDWYVTRKSESGASIPDNVQTYRTAVRTKSGEIENAINACTTIQEFIALHDVPVDENLNPTGRATIDNWPTLEE